ncbi:hypothetical protein M5D96_006241 [Drosophila gunungcola]|uniref:Uncharacterized protein n=1 Tax=Drosophila gunungcola TaxID=103775 RepID=A0A9P9YNQ7_9MUSC|nr:hypothetical protein M5D96_006241 [Drosophila gunungcola]
MAVMATWRYKGMDVQSYGRGGGVADGVGGTVNGDNGGARLEAPTLATAMRPVDGVVDQTKSRQQAVLEQNSGCWHWHWHWHSHTSRQTPSE